MFPETTCFHVSSIGKTLILSKLRFLTKNPTFWRNPWFPVIGSLTGTARRYFFLHSHTYSDACMPKKIYLHAITSYCSEKLLVQNFFCKIFSRRDRKEAQYVERVDRTAISTSWPPTSLRSYREILWYSSGCERSQFKHTSTCYTSHTVTIELGALAAGCYITKLPDTIAISDSEQRGKIDGFPHIGH